MMRLYRHVSVFMLLVAVAGASIGLAALRGRRDASARRARVPTPPPLAGPIEVPVPLVPAESDWRICPAVGDLDDDGRPDLLVGGGLGRMRLHRNVGTASRPEFAPPIWFDELCPGGRIPTG